VISAVFTVLTQPVRPGLTAAPEPYPRISREAFDARLPFFDYDRAVPLEGRVVRELDGEDTVRRKLVFRSAQGFLVPGMLEVPKTGTKPFPLVLLLHGWSGNKDDWWRDGGYISGGEMRKALLAAGYAVLALDAATHGERSHEIDFQHVNPFEDLKAPARRNYFTFADIAVQTVKDYRRALDFLAERKDPALDLARVALVGYSLGGMDAFYLLSVEPRIRCAVACVPPLQSAGYGPTAPIDYTWGIGRVPFLLVLGRKDELGDPARVEASYESYLKNPNTSVLWFDSGHKLPQLYVPAAAGWLKQKL
jgi:dienelactone hydrolase